MDVAVVKELLKREPLDLAGNPAPPKLPWLEHWGLGKGSSMRLLA